MKKSIFLLSFLILGFGCLHGAKNNYNSTLPKSTEVSDFGTLLSQLYPDDSSNHSSGGVSTQKDCPEAIATCEELLKEMGEECVRAYELLDIGSMPNFDQRVNALSESVVKEAYSRKVQALKYWYAGVYASTKNEQLLGPALKGNSFKLCAEIYRDNWGKLISARDFLFLYLLPEMSEE